MPHRLAQRMTLSDLEWLFRGSSVPSVWEGRALSSRKVIRCCATLARI